MNGTVLLVAGSDSGGGAGIEADIKTATALGAYAATAITALTAQNTIGIDAIFPVPADFVRRQIASVLSDIVANAIKTGMLVGAATIDAVADVREALAPDAPLVVDPVMVSTSGTRLLEDDALETLERRLIAYATVLTPNVPEAEALLGRRIESLNAMIGAAADLRALGPRIVMLKGGHLAGPRVQDVVYDGAGHYVLDAPRIETRHTHGTGCTLASAIAVGLAQGLAPRRAIERAHGYVQEAIRTAPGLGRGRGPLNHAHPCETFDSTPDNSAP
jgi:hydroxymethylpyrimidine/phosphomethylpyrimidine kinase